MGQISLIGLIGHRTPEAGHRRLDEPGTGETGGTGEPGTREPKGPESRGPENRRGRRPGIGGPEAGHRRLDEPEAGHQRLDTEGG